MRAIDARCEWELDPDSCDDEFRILQYSGDMRFLKFALCVMGACAVVNTAVSRPNVLFIAVDDLRPQLNSYGKTFMHTPNMDRLAARGVLFERAYCMVPTCGASRASLMTGVRPAPNRFVNYLTWAEKDAEGIPTLNTYFKNHGYYTVSLGKVFHHPTDSAHGWSEPAWRARGSDYQNTQAMRQAVATDRRTYPGKRSHRGPAYESADAADADYRDGQNSLRAVHYLQRFKGDPKQPFFLAVGFHKPHLPFIAPQKYWDLYDFAKIDVPPNYSRPTNVPRGAAHNSGELRAYAGIPPTGPVDLETARNLIHGYYACVSFIDAQIGRLLDELDRLDMSQNTIIVLWGDHGWQLGEHGMWNKHSCFETSMHAPLMVVAPNEDGVKRGTRVRALTEFIDVYPSLCELADLPIPSHTQGSSFVSLMKNPSLPGKPFAIGRFRSGDTVRTDRYRFSEYSDRDGSAYGHMLYDHETNPAETLNIAGDREPEVTRLIEVLRTHKGK